jgi:SAM-dependent methyltransferase
MFSKSAKYYDEIYTSIDKDYVAEAKKAHQFIRKYMHSSGKRLLDVACGTGLHAKEFFRWYQVDGLDIDLEMIKVAKKNRPYIRFHQGDMTNFDLGKTFDAITCLFSSIGYVQTKPRLQQAIRTMNKHLAPGGVLLIEPWFTPGQWSIGRVKTILIEKPGYKIVRMSRSAVKGKLSILDLDYMIGTAKRIEHVSERHELGLFTHEEYLSAFRAAKLEVIHDPEGLDGRGLYIGLKPNE